MMKKIANFSANLFYPVILKHPKPDDFNLHTQLYISTVNCVVFFCPRRYLPNEVFMLDIFGHNFYTFLFHDC